jgi:arabinogalactan oligomer/maltooligosaccharide transport system permease protein
MIIPGPSEKKTVMVAMFQLAGEVNIPWGRFAAGAVMVIIPIVLLFLWLQRYLESGLTVGGVKG